jgi:hypothetical protein
MDTIDDKMEEVFIPQNEQVVRFITQVTERSESINGISKLQLVPIKVNNEDNHPEQIYGKLEIQFPKGNYPFGLYEITIKQITQ